MVVSTTTVVAPPDRAAWWTPRRCATNERRAPRTPLVDGLEGEFGGDDLG